jgi:hypothetical protein
MRVEDVPSWGGHWNQGVLLSHTATAWLDLGEVRRAADALDALEQQNEDQPRRRLYYGLQCSRLGLLDHDIEAAAHHAKQAVEALPAIRSHRSCVRLGLLLGALCGRLAVLGHDVGDW